MTTRFNNNYAMKIVIRRLPYRIRFTAVLITLCLGFSTTGPSASLAQLIVDFEDLSLPPESAAPADAGTQTPFFSHGVSFNRTWNTDFNCCPGAWAYSNQTDLTTGGFANPYSAYALPTGGGVHGSSNFGIANNSFPGDAVVQLPAATSLQGVYVTNTTYAYLAVAEGNDGQEPGSPPLFVKGPFEAGDWFKLEIVGHDETDNEIGRTDFYLADFRNGAQTVIDDWTWVDLSGLGGQVRSLTFELSSTDVGMFGMNTPACFAVDDLTLNNLLGDFNTDFVYSCEDVDALVAAIVAGTTDPQFDLNSDGAINLLDVNDWLAIAGAANLPTGGAYLLGDANLNGTVDGDDFLAWNDDKFTQTAAWCQGDFDASGFVDGNDFLIWNSNKFQSTGLTTVPEPAVWFLWLLFAAFTNTRN